MSKIKHYDYWPYWPWPPCSANTKYQTDTQVFFSGVPPCAAHYDLQVHEQVVPPGLEVLVGSSMLLVRQNVNIVEAFTGYEQNNKYAITDSDGQDILYAIDVTSGWVRNCVPAPKFKLHILDSSRKMVIRLNNPFRCILQHLQVFSPPEILIGNVKQKCHLYPKFQIRNSNGDAVFLITGPACTDFFCKKEVEFKITTKDGITDVGKISRKWGGIGRETFTDASLFGVSFRKDLDVRMKALILGALFLIDMRYYE